MTPSPGPVTAGEAAAGVAGRHPGVRLEVGDFEVGETERRATAAVCLLVDLSYSMELRGTWGAAKQTALALHALVRTQYPQDAIQVIGFSNYARELRETDLAGLTWDMVQGTNLHHALVLAGRFLDRRPEHNPVVLVITDGEPTAHLRRDGQFWFDWPPSPETLELTLAEVDKMTRRQATMNIFMLADDERLTAFVDEVARRNGGRVLRAMPRKPGRVRRAATSCAPAARAADSPRCHERSVVRPSRSEGRTARRNYYLGPGFIAGALRCVTFGIPPPWNQTSMSTGRGDSAAG